MNDAFQRHRNARLLGSVTRFFLAIGFGLSIAMATGAAAWSSSILNQVVADFQAATAPAS